MNESQFIKGFVVGVTGCLLGACLFFMLTGCASSYTAPTDPLCSDTFFFGLHMNTCDGTARLPDERIECQRVDLGGVYADYTYIRDKGVMTTTVTLAPGAVPSVYDGQDWYRRWIEPNIVECLGFDRGDCVGDIDVFISHDCGNACTSPAADAHSTLSVHAYLDDQDLPTFTLYDSEKLWAWPVTTAAPENCEGTL